MPHLHGRKKDKGKSSNGKIPWDQYGYPLFCIRVKLRSRYGSNQHSSIIAQIVTFSGNTDDAIISCRENTSESSTIQVFQRKRFWFPVIFICNRPFIAVSLNRDKTTLRLFFSRTGNLHQRQPLNNGVLVVIPDNYNGPDQNQDFLHSFRRRFPARLSVLMEGGVKWAIQPVERLLDASIFSALFFHYWCCSSME